MHLQAPQMCALYHKSAMSSTLEQLPIGVLAHIVQQLDPCDQGAIRAVCQTLYGELNKSLKTAHFSFSSVLELAKLLGQLPGLQSLTLSASSRLLSAHSYIQLQSHIPAFVSSLAALSSLTSLVLSSATAQQFGTLKWAHLELQTVAAAATVAAAGAQDGTCASSQSDFDQQPTPLEHVLWVPEWLAAAPNLRKLVLQHPQRIMDCDYDITFSNPPKSLRLWLCSAEWAHKLTCIQLTGVPLTEATAETFQQLTRLQQVSITHCVIPPTAFEDLLDALGSCQLLTQLVVSHTESLLLPQQGWDALIQLKELDLSHSMLQELPANLGCLTALTALHLQNNSLTTLVTELRTLKSLMLLDVSHNWLSGCRELLSDLVTALTCLEVLRLDNVSDKKGTLVLPMQMGKHRGLQDLSIKHNFSVDWSSVLNVLPRWQGLKVLRMDNRMWQRSGLPLNDLLAVKLPNLDVQCEG